MSKKQKYQIEFVFVGGTTIEDIQNVCAEWHARQVERQIAEMPVEIARQVIMEINKMKEVASA